MAKVVLLALPPGVVFSAMMLYKIMSPEVNKANSNPKCAGLGTGTAPAWHAPPRALSAGRIRGSMPATVAAFRAPSGPTCASSRWAQSQARGHSPEPGSGAV